MRRSIIAACVTSICTLPSLMAQSDTDYSRAVQVFQPPSNYFSAGVRYSSQVTATFSNVGTVPSAHTIGDTTSEVTRTYDDGHVSKDARTTDAGADVPDDGRTNTWRYNYASQVTPDQGSIAFHAYSSQTEGGSTEADGGASAGLDLEYSRRLGSFGKRHLGFEEPVGWGVLAGVSLNAINAKTRGVVNATLHTITDTYSLLGLTPPKPGYSGPSSTTTTVTNPDGTTSTVTVDTTTYLANRPDSRTETDLPGGANVDGFWQVRGAFYTTRAGAWIRWHPKPKLGLRASAGASMTFIGMHMRYDERLMAEGIDSSIIISKKDQSTEDTYTVAGAFASFDLEWWISRRTAFFISGMYEYFADDAWIGLGDRSTRVSLSSGLVFRVGVTTRF